jgi:hypothetical protein
VAYFQVTRGSRRLLEYDGSKEMGRSLPVRPISCSRSHT